MRDAVHHRSLISVKKRNIIHYALNYQYKLFETNKDRIANHINNLPRLVFLCGNNHLYPITDDEQRETIFKSNAFVGGQIRKYKSRQAFDHRIANGTKTDIYIISESMNFYALLAHVQNVRETRELNGDYTYGTYRIVSMCAGLCHTVFNTKSSKETLTMNI